MLANVCRKLWAEIPGEGDPLHRAGRFKLLEALPAVSTHGSACLKQQVVAGASFIEKGVDQPSQHVQVEAKIVDLVRVPHTRVFHSDEAGETSVGRSPRKRQRLASTLRDVVQVVHRIAGH